VNGPSTSGLPRTAGGPIFLLGITGRSGTNYVRDLIALHPDCEKARSPIWEDFFLHEAAPLFEFERKVRSHWKSWNAAEVGSELLPRVGAALLAFLSEGVERRVIAKTPSVRNLERFFDLFPNAYLVIIVRDPRSVVYSAVASFKADAEGWARDWVKGATAIASLQDDPRAEHKRFHVVRYEDLVTNGRSTITELLRFLDLGQTEFNFGAAADLPPRGSSQLAGTGEMHWRPTQSPGAFEPLRRWEAWPESELERIEWISSPHMDRFGYVPVTAAHRPWLHRVRDAALLSRLAMRQIGGRLRRR